MTFTVIDTKTGQYPDTWEIACKEEWAKCLCYCDIEGFAVEEDGTLVLLATMEEIKLAAIREYNVIIRDDLFPGKEENK